jgi:exopolyphosphatase/guanosine-5'-triphosphate,3'-diphosphate pyrophosphatase
MVIAVIDLGTNTFNLLICKIFNNSYTILHNSKVSPKIGKEGIHLGILTDQAIERGLKGIETLYSVITSFNCEKTIAIGTSALRNAKNSKTFCSLVKQHFNIDITIINGLQEADYIFNGNKLAYNWGNKIALILDIGGGSNECIICTNSEILWKHSFENGMQRISSRVQQEYPFSEKNKTDIFDFLLETFQLLIQKAQEFNIEFLIGSSGPFDTFRDVIEIKRKQTTNSNPYYIIESQDFLDLHQSLINSNKKEIGAIAGMDESRIDLLPISSSITNFIISQLQIPQIIQSKYSLKEGVINKLIHQ